MMVLPYGWLGSYHMPMSPFSHPSITSPSPNTNVNGSPPSVSLKAMLSSLSIDPCTGFSIS